MLIKTSKSQLLYKKKPEFVVYIRNEAITIIIKYQNNRNFWTELDGKLFQNKRRKISNKNF